MNATKKFINTYLDLVDAFNRHYPPEEDFEVITLLNYFEQAYYTALEALKEKLIYLGFNQRALYDSNDILISAYYSNLIQNLSFWFYIRNLARRMLNPYNNKDYVESVHIINRSILPVFNDLYKTLI